MRGLSFDAILDLFQHRPAKHQLVIYSKGSMWIVLEADAARCSLIKMDGMSVGQTRVEVIDPQPTNYWYIPLDSGKLSFPSLVESPESE